MDRSLWAVLAGTFTLRFSTGLTGAMLTYYLAELDKHHGVLDQAIGLPPSPVPDAFTFALIAAAFYASELILSPIFGILSDRRATGRSCNGDRCSGSSPWSSPGPR